jgi:CSLREA domain-containing protein
MFRPQRHDWILSTMRTSGPVSARRRRSAGVVGFHRRLRIEPLEDRRLLANVTVSNLNDIVNGDTTSIGALIALNGGDGISLREAILASNADSAADTIEFGTLAGTIQLTNAGHVGQIAISNSLTINGPGPSVLTIRAFSGASSSGDGARIFAIDDGSATTFTDVSISGLTLTAGDPALSDGADGGAVFNSENLTLTDCTISDNRLSGTNRRGGGVFSQLGSLTVSASTISDNTAWRGGGIYTAGPSTMIHDSTINDNSTGSSFGNGGGGIAVSTVAGDTTTIVNSTISNNRTFSNGGGILNDGAGSLIVSYSTITLNRVNFTNRGGGIHSNHATTSLEHTIVAGNLGGQPSIRNDLAGSVASVRYSLIGDNTGATIADNGGNQIGTGAAPINALLAPLSDNAGPTLTHALLTGSPAIDAGDPAAVAGAGTVPLQDQRGAVFVRVADGDGSGGSRIDVGAYERQTLPDLDLVVDTLADENDHNYSDGDLSLREAIDLANGSIGADTISFADALTSGEPITILLTRGHLVIAESLTINGPGADVLTISASDPTPTTKNGDGSRIFNIDDANANSVSNVSISGLTLNGGDTSTSGGAIWSNDNLTLADSIITGNASAALDAQGGGGIYSGYGGDLTVIRSVIANNSSGLEGGGIRKRGRRLVIEDSRIEMNVAWWTGGGVSAANDVAVEISRTSIRSNACQAPNYDGGGGLFFFDANVLLRDSLISGNSSLFIGGGIDSRFTYLSMIGSTVSGNTSGSHGGGLHSNVGRTLEIAYSIITANMAPAGFAGGVYASGGNPGSRVFRSSIIAGNANSDVASDVTVFQSAGYNLIGTGNSASLFNQPGDQTGHTSETLKLGPLAGNGGPTWTHALLPGSPAIDAGDPTAIAGVGDVPDFDQRGNPFTRVHGGRIDVGAFEQQPPPGPELPGDYNQNGVVEVADYVVWRKTLGASGLPAYSGADGDGDGTIDQDDHGVWRANFGRTIGAGSGGQGAGSGKAISASAEPLPEATQPPALPGVRLAPVARIGNGSASGASVADVKPQGNVAISTAGRASSGTLRDSALATWMAVPSRGEGAENEDLIRSLKRMQDELHESRLSNVVDEAFISWELSSSVALSGL